MSTAVIVLSWNRPRMLTECLASIELQSVPPRRVIVSDDGSRGFCVSEHVAKSLPWAYVIAAPPVAPMMRSSAPRLGRLINTALGLANSCEFVTYICDDDLMHPEWIERLQLAMRTTPEAHYCVGRWYQFADRTVPVAATPRIGRAMLAVGNFAHRYQCHVEGLSWPYEHPKSIARSFTRALVEGHGRALEVDAAAGWHRLHKYNESTPRTADSEPGNKDDPEKREE